ncbi:hypothetical protein CC80DRAFT_544340 [Byssothecium circinans]|uniref:Uncharacterized protein n=1 Tax=Byssothecium circinans TaxID=147558 RepID=A0A6A5U7V1_9PLEO|nr:hypothetical protein CC80DRAFT_544340 [Byssothecium circinans]
MGHTIPKDIASWLSAIKAARLQERKLGEMPNNFSGSKIPHEAFLQLRALWIEPKRTWHWNRELFELDILSREDVALAEKMVTPGGNLRRTGEQLNNFLNQMSTSGSTSPKTPITRSRDNNSDMNVEYALGAFTPLVSLWRLLTPYHLRPDPVPVATSGPSMPHRLLPHNVSKFDLLGKLVSEPLPEDALENYSDDETSNPGQNLFAQT